MRYLMLAIALLGLSAVDAQAVDRKAIDASVERGVAALRMMQRPDGTWPHGDLGATALAALAMLECGVDRDDKAIQSAARAVRTAGFSMTHTYSLSLSVLFLDRLDEASDTPLIESMVVRLLAGQLPTTGGWTYGCPNLSEEEIRRIRAEMDTTRTLRGSRDLTKLPAKGKRTVADLPPETKIQLARLGRGVGPGGIGASVGGDNSNTQFATLALWVGRRYGIPTQGALLRVDQRFRTSQNPDGGWSYIARTAGVPFMGDSSATMTCAGLLGLACGHGSAHDIKKAKDPKAEKRDIGKDAQMRAGLGALSTAIGKPIGWTGTGRPPGAIPSASKKAYYLLWSIERVAVALNLETIGKKDWYNWGSEILLANQVHDGSWIGEYGPSGADTSFALLFLRKANLARDLSGSIAGLKDAAKVLRAGGVGGGGLRDDPKEVLAPTGIGEKGKTTDTASTRPLEGGTATKRPATTGSGLPGRETKPPAETTRPKPAGSDDTPSRRLAEDLVGSTGTGRSALMKKMRDTRGVAYTEALVTAIPRLDVDGRREARAALAERFTRLKETTLREYLKDEDAEIRRAAALACAAKGAKSQVPDLIRLLSDAEGPVQRAAHAALKELTKKDFGPPSGATEAQRKAALAAWQKWWKTQARE